MNVDLKKLDEEFREAEAKRIAAAVESQVRAARGATQAQAMHNKFDSFLAEQIKRRETNKKIMTRGGAALVALLTAGGVPVGYQAIASPPEIQPREVQDTVVKKSAAVEVRVEKVEKRQKALGRAAVRQHILTTDTHGDLRRRLDAMSEESRKIDEPPSVKDAREKSARIREEIGAAKLLGDYADEIDPFDLLAQPK